MISPDYDFNQFVETTKKKDVHEIIYLADQEAVAAWRRSYQPKGSSCDNDQKSIDYQNRLKNLIYYIRSSVAQTDIKNPFRFTDNKH
jgi:hypothetical protein